MLDHAQDSSPTITDSLDAILSGTVSGQAVYDAIITELLVFFDDYSVHGPLLSESEARSIAYDVLHRAARPKEKDSSTTTTKTDRRTDTTDTGH